jgi:hypothetical protein
MDVQPDHGEQTYKGRRLDVLVGDQPVDVAFVGDQLDVVPDQRTQCTFVSGDRHPGEPVPTRPPHLTQV